MGRRRLRYDVSRLGDYMLSLRDVAVDAATFGAGTTAIWVLPNMTTGTSNTHPRREPPHMMMSVTLVKQYCRDNEWWLAYPCDPRWSYFEPGEVLEVSEEEARDMIQEGIATPRPER